MNNYIIIFCILNSNKIFVNVNVFIDFETTLIGFINFEFTRFQQFFLFILFRSRVLKTFDDNFIVFKKIIHTARTFFYINKY